METMGWAVKQLRDGAKVCRAGWNGKGMFLFHVGAGVMNHPAFTGAAAPYIAMRTTQGDAVPWLASQTDLLATDWQIAG